MPVPPARSPAAGQCCPDVGTSDVGSNGCVGVIADQRSYAVGLTCMTPAIAAGYGLLTRAAEQTAGAIGHAAHADVHRIAGDQQTEMPPAPVSLPGTPSAARRVAAILRLVATIGCDRCVSHDRDHPSERGEAD